MATEHEKKRKQQVLQEAGDRQPAAQETASGKKQKCRPQQHAASDDAAAAGTSGREQQLSRQQPQQVQAAGNGQHAAPRNKEKVLVLCTRGVTFRYRHLMNDLTALLPHSKRDNKLDTKNDRGVINEVADMKSCTSVLFFEVRKKQDLYLWLSKAPGGPSAKFLVQNVHTMDELKLTGNHLKGSRPVLSFDSAFDQQPHWQLMKEMLTQMFATPRRHHKGKPFFDHVMTFTIADERIWFRNYQVVVPLDKKKADTSNVALVETGPRFCMQPIKVFAGSFGGATLYENPRYVSPNAVRSMLKRQKAGKYSAKVGARAKRQAHEAANPQPRDELAEVFR